MFLELVITITSIIPVLYYQGYLKLWYTWYTAKRAQVKLVMNLINQLRDVNTSKSDIVFSIYDTNVTACINYERLGSMYRISIPYNRQYASRMMQFDVHLLDNQGTIISNITQQPGIPYLVTAASLGGSSIRIVNQETGIIHDYSQDTIPSYGVEAME